MLGLVGTNGIGKSTALQVLAGKLKPNLGRYDSAPDWSEILTYFRGSELQNYFTRILEDNLKVKNKTGRTTPFLVYVSSCALCPLDSVVVRFVHSLGSNQDSVCGPHPTSGQRKGS